MLKFLRSRTEPKQPSAVADAESVADPGYYTEGLRWEEEIYRKTARSRALAWTVSLFCMTVALISLGVVWALVPLKTFEPYVVVVDKTTGFTEVTRALQPGGRVTQDEAVTMANVVRYVRARETYDAKGLKDNYDLAQLLSDEQAARDLANLFAPSNANNPAKILGANTTVSVTVKSVTFPNTRTALVRFQTDEKGLNTTTARHWVGVVRFRYSGAPVRNEWRFDNPLGFQVIEYRRDQETVTPSEGITAARS